MSAAVTECRVDWLTATSSHAQGATQLLNKGLEVINQNVDTGMSRRAWYWQGYRGTQCESVAVGWRIDGACVRLGGVSAGLHWSDFLPMAGHVSRIDLAVTIQADTGTGGIARQAYRAAFEHRPTNGRKPECSLVLSTRGGETAYIGRRISDRFLRLYNKHAESAGAYPVGSWRYEIEYKGKLAGEVSERLRIATDTSALICDLVHAEFTRSGVAPAFDTQVGGVAAVSAVADRSDNARRMLWLETQVRATIERLSASYSEEEILRALGIWYTRPVADAETPNRSAGLNHPVVPS